MALLTPPLLMSLKRTWNPLNSGATTKNMP